MLKTASYFIVIAIGLSYYFGAFNDSDPPIPKLPETYWGPAERKNKDDTTIRPFKIDIGKNVIDDLNERLDKTRKYIPPLEDSAWTFGVSTKYFKTVVDYWRKNYDWTKRQNLLNKYPQFMTTIQGLDIHFYHVKPSKTVQNGKSLKVIPLLLVHGWPGSFVEFQKIMPMLTTPRAGADFVFEVIAPSLPGYGFSQGAVRPGLATGEIAVIFKNLMTRLGFSKFYTQGGDWGSIITQDLAALFPEKVSGSHMNMCFVQSPKATMWQLIGTIFPSLVVPPEHQSKMYPLSYHFFRTVEETGYMHIQATKPDTIGTALNESPVSLAIYILEKFSTWTNPEYRFREDGGLLEKYTMDELLDNVMIYWVTNSITTSMRLYAESFTREKFGKFQKHRTTIPVACAAFPHELVYIGESIAKLKHRNLVQFSNLPRGGHFAAFEEPELLADDFWKFVKTVEKA